MAGIAVAGLMLPEAVAYAGIAGLAPGRAIVAAVVGGLAYAAIGRSRLAVVAPTSSSAALLAAAFVGLGVSGSSKDAVATIIVLMVGLLFVLGAVLRADAAASLIARPVLRGFSFGLALTIIIKQLPILLGIAVASHDLPGIIVDLAANLDRINAPSAVVGLAALLALLGLRRVPELPATPLVLVVGIAVSIAFDLDARGVPLVGTIAPAFALPSLTLPSAAELSRLVQLALPIALVIFAESWGTMRTLALMRGDQLAPGRELSALGIANIASGLAGGMPVGAGFSAGNANAAAGGQTRASAIIAALVLAGLIVGASGYVGKLPGPVLAAIVIAALTHALRTAPFRQLFKVNRDQWVALAAAAGVLSLGVLNGMLVAVALALVALLRRLTASRVAVLGRIGDHDFADVATHSDAKTLSGIIILRPDAPLFFGNADTVATAISGASPPAGSAVIVSLEQSNDLDSTAAEVLGEIAQTLRVKNVTLRLARVHDNARIVLDAAGLSGLYDPAGYSVADAVATVIKGTEPCTST